MERREKRNFRKNKRIRNRTEKDRKKKKKEKCGDKGSECRENKHRKENRRSDRGKTRRRKKIEKAYEIKGEDRKKEIVVTVESWEMKRNIMMKKNLEKGVYINNDLTRREREIQGKKNDNGGERKR